MGNTTDPLQLAVATDRQGLWLAGEARVRRGTIAAQHLLNTTYSESGYLHPTQARGGFGTAGLVRSEALLWSVGRRWPADGWAPHSGRRHYTQVDH